MVRKKSKRKSRRERGTSDDRVQAREEKGIPRGRPKGGALAQRLPMNMSEVRDLLSNRKEARHLRHPMTQRENRYWNKLWQFKGRPYNKPPYKGDSKKRKQRQEKQSKKWRKKRERNNLKKAS